MNADSSADTSPRLRALDPEARGQPPLLGGILADGRKQRLRDGQQEIERAEHRRRDDHPQRNERGHAGIAGDQRHHDQRRHQQAERMRPGGGDQCLAALALDAPQPDDEVEEDGRRQRREQHVGRDGGDQRREQGLVDDLEEDQNSQSRAAQTR